MYIYDFLKELFGINVFILFYKQCICIMLSSSSSSFVDLRKSHVAAGPSIRLGPICFMSSLHNGISLYP
jgi:hypothetical protein